MTPEQAVALAQLVADLRIGIERQAEMIEVLRSENAALRSECGTASSDGKTTGAGAD